MSEACLFLALPMWLSVMSSGEVNWAYIVHGYLTMLCVKTGDRDPHN